jgi:hypothetical protein
MQKQEADIMRSVMHKASRGLNSRCLNSAELAIIPSIEKQGYLRTIPFIDPDGYPALKLKLTKKGKALIEADWNVH